MSKLVELYANEIQAGNITISDAPAKLKGAVEDEIMRRATESDD